MLFFLHKPQQKFNIVTHWNHNIYVTFFVYHSAQQNVLLHWIVLVCVNVSLAVKFILILQMKVGPHEAPHFMAVVQRLTSEHERKFKKKSQKYTRYKINASQIYLYDKRGPTKTQPIYIVCDCIATHSIKVVYDLAVVLAGQHNLSMLPKLNLN